MTKNVLVTGGTGTIGRAVSLRLAKEGWRVTILARDEERVKDTLDALPGRGHKGICLDVSDRQAWEDNFPCPSRLDGLVIAAAIYGPIGPLCTVDPRELERSIAINVTGALLTLHYALPALEEALGKIVAFSGAGSASLPRYDAYAASKAAVVRLIENVAAEYEGVVGANSVAPGFIVSRIHKATLWAGPSLAGDEYDRTVERLDGGGQSLLEVASLVSFLLSEAASGITGRLVSAQWDDWRNEEIRQNLREDPSFGRLRRRER